MIGLEPVKDTGAMQEGVHEGIDCNEGRASAQPSFSLRVGPSSRSARIIDQSLSETPTICLSGSSSAARICLARSEGQSSSVGGPQTLIDPADEIAFTNIAKKEEQAVGGLVEQPLAKRVQWQRALEKMSGSEQAHVFA